MRTIHHLLGASLLLLGLPAVAPAQQGGDCQVILGENSSGRPHDFRDPEDKWLVDKVETNHFLSQTEQLIKGTTGPLPSDIVYTLHWFPSHYRALNSLANFELKNGFRPSVNWDYDAECYFQRAVAFNPADPTIYVIWGNFMYHKKEYQEALAKYNQALDLDPDSSEAHYNIGLLYVQLADLPNARKHADRAYALGYPLEGLRHKVELLEKGAHKSGAAAQDNPGSAPTARNRP